jgi:hypothetical protein
LFCIGLALRTSRCKRTKSVCHVDASVWFSRPRAGQIKRKRSILLRPGKLGAARVFVTIGSSPRRRANETRDHLSIAVRRLHRPEHHGSKRRRLRRRRGPGRLRRCGRCHGRRTSCRRAESRCRRAEACRRHSTLTVRCGKSLIEICRVGRHRHFAQ